MMTSSSNMQATGTLLMHKRYLNQFLQSDKRVLPMNKHSTEHNLIQHADPYRRVTVTCTV